MRFSLPRRPYRALLPVAAATLLATLAPATPAAAWGACSVVVPSRLTVDAPYERFPVRLAADCADAGTSYASWDVRHSYHGPSDILIFDETTTDYLTFYDWESLGTYYVEPGGAWDWDYADVAQNTRTVQIKLGSRLGLSSSRSGSYVTLTTAATRYIPSADGFRPWSGASVALQYRTCSTCAWATKKTVTTGSDGRVSYRLYMPQARYYRAVSANTGMTWGRTSATTYR